MTDNLEQFLGELDAIVEDFPRAHRDMQVALVASAFEDIVEHSPVKTGAFRTEHVIGQGESLDLLYESENRVGPDTIVHDIGQGPLEPPNAGDARAAITEAEPFGLLTIFNQRFYGAALEAGSSQQAPNGVFGPAADRLEVLAEVTDVSGPRFER